MKFTYSTLKEHLDTNKTPKEIADELVSLGIEVESLEDGKAVLEPFRLAKISKADKHPDADRLQVCLVDCGELGADPLQIVCGAPNARAGILVALALPGAIIPTTGDKLKKGKVRGIESAGMMCSAKELCLGEESDGIMEIQTDMPIGSSLANVLDAEIIFDVGLTPNRGDCFSVYGIARDLAAKGIGKLKTPQIKNFAEGLKSQDLVSIESKNCHAFTAVLIEGVQNKSSPDWLQNYLKHAGMKPISTLVDITNYIAHYYGRPLHVFDADVLSGKLVIREAKAGEQIEALDDITYKLGEEDILVADDNGPQAIGGIMGGLKSGCTESTTSVLLEGAIFDQTAITRTGQRLNIHSEARNRFERGVDTLFVKQGVELALELLLELCGGEVKAWQFVDKKPYQKNTINFSPSLYGKRTGCEVDEQKGRSILENLGIKVEEKSTDSWLVTAPSWRHDINCAEDLVEEWLRLDGYNTLPVVSLPAAVGMQEIFLPEIARRAMTASGYDEAITWSFTSEKKAKFFSNGSLAELANPLSADQAVMRPSVVLSLLEVVERNIAHGEVRGQFFEIGKSYQAIKGYEDTTEQSVVAALKYGQIIDRHWSKAQKSVDFYTIKADFLKLLSAWQMPTANLNWNFSDVKWLHPGQSAEVSLGKKIIARVGVVHPAISKKVPMVAFEVYMDNLPKLKGKIKADEVSEFPAVTRDFAFIVGADFSADSLCRVISKVGQNFIKKTYVFDNYVDPKTNIRSVAIEVTMQSNKETLNDSMIQTLTVQIIKAADDKCGATLKS